MTEEQEQKPLDLHELANSGGFGSAKSRLAQAGLFKERAKPVNWKQRYQAAKVKLQQFMTEEEIDAWIKEIEEPKKVEDQ